MLLPVDPVPILYICSSSGINPFQGDGGGDPFKKSDYSLPIKAVDLLENGNISIFVDRTSTKFSKGEQAILFIFAERKAVMVTIIKIESGISPTPNMKPIFLKLVVQGKNSTDLRLLYQDVKEKIT